MYNFINFTRESLMLLQELFLEANSSLNQAYGIFLDSKSSDVEFSTPPENLEEIGFVLKIDADGLMDEALMDLVISYRLTNLDVLVEVPSDLINSGKLDPKYLLQLAMNVDFAIALLPPGSEHTDPTLTIEEYNNVVIKVLDEILAKPNFDKFVYPISNFLEYLMLEQVLSPEVLVNFRPEQRYVVDTFSSKMTKESSDSFKKLIRDRIYDFYGSKEDFELVAKTMLESALEKSENFYKSHIQQHMSMQNN